MLLSQFNLDEVVHVTINAENDLRREQLDIDIMEESVDDWRARDNRRNCSWHFEDFRIKRDVYETSLSDRQFKSGIDGEERS